MLRAVVVVRVVDLDARARRRARAREDLEGLVVGVAWALFGWRVELAVLAVLVGCRAAASRGVTRRGRRGASWSWWSSSAVLAWRPARALVRRVLYAMRVRRAWARAAIDAGRGGGSVPVLRACGRVGRVAGR